MTTITTRAGKGSPLTNNEVDANFNNLNTDKIETLTSTDSSVTITGTGSSRDLSVPVNPDAVSGPASATDNAVARFDGTTGKLIQNGLVTIDDNGNASNVNSISFDTTPATLPTGEGTMFWDADKGAVAYVMQGGDVTQEIGESQYMYIQASANITKGQVVMFTGAVGGSGIPTGAPASGVTDGSYIMGIAAEDITSGTNGFVQTFGILKPINTTGLSEGAVLWYDPSVTGGLTATKPSAPNIKVQIAAVTAGNSAGGAIFIRVTAGSKLGDTDSNVLFGTLASGELLVYNATAGYWVNARLTAGTGISVTNGAGSVTVANTGVTSFSAGTTGLTPNIGTAGDVTLGGTLAVGNGGTGASTADGALTNLGGTTVGKSVFTAATAAAAQQAMDVEVGVDVQALLVSGINIKTINFTSLLGSGDIPIVGAVPYGLFRKADPTIVAWTKTGNFTVSTATTLYIEVNGELKTIAASTAVTMPGSATVGTDYAIWAKTDGSLEATTNHTSPPTANARRVGGFHYAPGGNATGTSGGNTTAQINEYSFWDLKWRPACPDPRGMTLVANAFWADIYLCGVDHYTNGTSKYNVTIADGASLPKISAAFGGNGSTTYARGTWFAFNEIMARAGKRLPTYLEACAFAYGTTEASSGGTDPVSTILRAAYTSKWGVMLATGNMYQWLRDFIANGSGTGAWQTGLTETRGDIYTNDASARAGVFGGAWVTPGSNVGSRCSRWSYDPSDSRDIFGGRGVCDHLQLD